MASKKAPAGKKGAKAASKPDGDPLPSLSRHPRAQRQIREAKAWAGIVGFGLVLLLSMQAGLPTFDAGVRALAAGIACYVIAWTIAVAVWRHVARAEISLAQQRAQESTSS